MSKAGWWWGAVLLVLLAGCLGWREITSPDLGFHLNSARWMLDQFGWPRAEPFLFTASSCNYVDLQWLFQLGVFYLFQFSGPAGLSILTLFLVGALLVLGWWRMGMAGTDCPAGRFVIGVLFILSQDWEPRPGLLSALCLSLLLILLDLYRQGASRLIWWVLPLFLLWVNTHALFSIGLVVLGIHAFGSVVAWMQGRDHQNKKRAAVLISSILVASFLACLFNPYGVEGLIFPFRQWLILNSPVYNHPSSGIAELRGLMDLGIFLNPDGNFYPQANLIVRQILFFLIFFAYAYTWKKRRLVEWILLGAFAVLAWGAYRNFLFLMVVAFPVLGEAWSKFFGEGGQTKARYRSWIIKITAGFALLTCLLVASGRWYGWQGIPENSKAGLSRAVIPLFLKDSKALPFGPQKIMTGFGVGGWAAYFSGARVTIDGRIEVYPTDLYQTYQASLTQPKQFKRWLSACLPEAVLVHHQVQGLWLEALSLQPDDWHLTYQDEYFSFFSSRRFYPDLPPSPRPVAGQDFPSFSMEEARKVRKHAARLPARGFFGWLKGMDAFPQHRLRWSAVYNLRHEFAAAEGQALAGLRESPYFFPNLWVNLADCYEAQKRWADADGAWKVVLNRDPRPENRRLYQLALSRRVN